MQKIIGVTDLQRRFRSVFEEVVEDHVPYVLTRGSRPQAALVPYDEYLRFQEASETEVLRKFDRMWTRISKRTAGLSEEEIATDVAAARAEL